MFKHILVPIDGSPAALSAMKAAARFAKEQKARITAFWAGPNWEPNLYAYAAAPIPAGVITPEQHAAHVRAAARRYLGAAKQVAEAAGVRCATDYVEAGSPYVAIVEAAQRLGCDLIVMASHTRGVARALLGSQTSKVAAHARVPVMVVRP